MNDQMVDHPPHYNQYSIEVIEVTRNCTFNIGNSIKYILRHLDKGTSRQDLEKALWYLRDHVNKGNVYCRAVPEDTADNLRTLAEEYSGRKGALSKAAAALRLLANNDADMAQMCLSAAIKSVS